MYIDSVSPSQGFACTDLVLLVYGLTRLGLSPLAPDPATLGFLLLVRSHLRLEFALLAFGISKSELFLLVLDYAHLESFLFLQSHMHLGLISFAYGMS